jgi:chemotaxis methyl-accepting protein methylase
MLHHLAAAAIAIVETRPVRAMYRPLERMLPRERFARSRWWRSMRFAITQSYADRSDKTFTRFMRVPTQFEALGDVVVPGIFPQTSNEPLRVVVMGCSNGAEAFSIASVLTAKHPGLNFEIDAYDVSDEMIAQAKSGRYPQDHVITPNFESHDFVATTFDRDHDAYIVKPSIARRVRFSVANLFDAPTIKRIAAADIVFAQNVLINFPRARACEGFRQVAKLLKPRAVLFIDGMDVDLRQKMTREAGLRPLDYKIREIHEDARVIRGDAWPWVYWGLEPFVEGRDWRERYATIFLTESAQEARRQ